ncbi:4Fe-4S dicluster domain-containing protein [Arcobacter sp. FWKO B]|uniref:4Fe-4S dicluster domain-containing protein n=1 Tax=Arcobacter sp. FWKO B TaxID=2593672 RepID=UPI0018A4FC84|nr:4Fe-4S dicluster domain-containing protein [Arcobacter sp. FWKO B]QOG11651.1 4Fe-4S dicluster domain-containing protein [Arcobacter sp. FWKO B]
MDINRRMFFKKASLAVASGAVLMTPKAVLAKENVSQSKKIGSYIDLSICDGCKDLEIAKCVSSCRDKNSVHFPEPELPLKPYWPRKNYEDWSNEKDRVDRLTPYNWTFVEKVKVNEQDVYIPRRCMHCDNPSCLNLCPFGTIEKTKEGMVAIDRDYCMGGAKCRDVCPWEIPQRQAGVGLYMKLAPMLAGGGVMYKCDGCADLVAKNELPVCEVSCPKNAIKFGDFEEIKALAQKRADEIGGYLYGLEQSGGTGTIYISKVPFEEIDKAIALDKIEKNDKKLGRPHMKVDLKDSMEDAPTWMAASLIAPIAGIAAAAIAVHKSKK